MSQSTTDSNKSHGQLMNNTASAAPYSGAWPVSGDISSMNSAGDKMGGNSPRNHSSTPSIKTTNSANLNNFSPRGAQSNMGAAPAGRIPTNPDSAADKFAPDLSDMEFDTASLATRVPQAGGTAWSMDPIEQQNRHLISPSSAANACGGRSISLINAMQSCDLVARENQKTASYVPVMNSSAAPSYTGPPNASASNHNNNYHFNENKQQQQPALPTRMAPNPPRKSSLSVPGAVKPSQTTVELDDNEEIFEISV